MTDKETERVTKLVPLLDEVSSSELHNRLPAIVASGDLPLYVRVPSSKAVYVDGIHPLLMGTMKAGEIVSRPLLVQWRDAESVSSPRIRYPMQVQDVVYLGLSAEDARRLFESKTIDVHWFPCIICFPQQSAPNALQLIRMTPYQSRCCLRPNDGRPKHGPLVGNNQEHALIIELRDVYVEQSAIKRVLRSKEGLFGLRNISPGMYVLCRAAEHFNKPDKGVMTSQASVKEWVRNEAKGCGIDDGLFNKEVLKQVKKLINTKHHESQGGVCPPDFDLTVLDDEEARALALHHWLSSRMILAIHAAHTWQQMVSDLHRSWKTACPGYQINMIHDLMKKLEKWGFTGVGERDALLRVVIYPVKMKDVRRTLEANRPGVSSPKVKKH